MAAPPTRPRADYDYLIKLLMVGDSTVGKSTLLLRFSDGSFTTSHITTIGIDFKIRTIELDGKRIKLQIWDTAGEERFRPITNAYYRGVMGLLLVYDVTDETSFRNIRNSIRNIEQHASANVNKILVGNMKADMVESKRIVPTSKGQALADEYGIKFFETSEKTSFNVEQVFFSIARDIKQRLDDRDTNTKAEVKIQQRKPFKIPLIGRYIKKRLADNDTNTKQRLADSDPDPNQRLADGHSDTKQRIADKEPDTKKRLAGSDPDIKQKLADSDTDTKKRLVGSDPDDKGRLAASNLDTKQRLADSDLDTKQRLTDSDPDTKQRLADSDPDIKKRFAGSNPDTKQRLDGSDTDTKHTLADSDPDTMQRLAGGDPDTKQTLADIDHDNKQRLSGSEPDTKQRLASSDPDAKQKHAGSDLDTKQRLADSDPDTKQRLSGNEPDSRQRLASSDPETKQRLVNSDPDTMQRLDDSELDTKQRLADSDPDTKQRLADNVPYSKQRLAENGPDTKKILHESDTDTKAERKNIEIPLHVINDCTEFFSERNFIGKGGYGRVYKGILTWEDHVNQLVAVKRLDVTGFQGKKEFLTEVTMLSRYQHENIVTLIGSCKDNKELILVYEYASHGSLDTYLRGDITTSGVLSWPQLLKICIGIASALEYLHDHVAEKHRIIHRDIKSANVLLDENWNAKLADFGLAKIGLANQEDTFVITNIAGTPGYNDPQYEKTGILTKESDVFSFGVVLFEVLCGRLAYVGSYHDERRFLSYFARTCYKNGQLANIIDERIKKDIKPRTLSKFSAIAYQCLKETREERPTITKVVFQLKEAWKIQVGDEGDIKKRTLWSIFIIQDRLCYIKVVLSFFAFVFSVLAVYTYITF